MHSTRKFVLAAAAALLLLILARPAFAAGDLKSVLQQLDEAAKNFHSASADIEWKSIQTEPIPETDIKSGMVYYERHGSDVRMAAHLTKFNGQPFAQSYTVSKGVFELYDRNQNHVTRYRNANMMRYALLGFGASGKDMEDLFTVSYLGEETVDGVNTDKLQLIPKDPKVLSTIHSIDLWIDPTRDVNLKQVLDEGDGQSLEFTYSNIKVNVPVSGADLTLKTNKSTTYTDQ
ncbi:MAG: LolA family protein [Terracidiphilus sp.]